MNREQWLTELAAHAEPLFRGFKLEAYRLTCGFPSKHALGMRRRRIGECHYPTLVSVNDGPATVVGYHNIFISPLLDDPLEVAGTVVHEMTHVAAGAKAGHARGFVKVAKHVGLTKGKPTEAMPGDRLNDTLRRYVEAIGAYPHTAIKPTLREVKVKPMVTVRCEGCEYSVRVPLDIFNAVGPPVCGCGTAMAVKEREE